MATHKVAILGGYGTYGRLIAEQLARSKADIVIAGRDLVKGRAWAEALQAEFALCDVANSASLQKVIAGADLVINAAGPFQVKEYAVAQACIDHGCHYIDLGDGRDYVSGITRLHDQAKAKGVFVCVGASTSPAVTSAAVAELRSHFPHIHTIKVALSAGNQNQAGISTIASILTYVGLPVQVWHNKHWQARIGWEMGEFVEFPAPVGRRRVQLCNVPDLELFPHIFEADNVIFKAGVELTLFNYALAGLAQLRKRRPSLNLAPLAKPLVNLSKLFNSLGTLHGCCAVWLADEQGQHKSLAVVAPQNGPCIPAAPAVLLARKLLTDGIPASGAFPCVGFINLSEFADFLAPFSIFIVRGENGVWSSL